MMSYERDIKPLFTGRDRDEMDAYLDLWSFSDVREYARRITDRLEAGDMPCDGAWPQANIDLFRRWVQEGCNP